jgi:hypothetical protein
MAVLGPLEVGSGLLNFLSPNYTPVAGRAGLNDWTYGGGGNYIRPWTSFSQRIVEASNSLGPFAMRLGGNITGRIVISTQGESLGDLAYRDQDWWNVNDGNTGYPSKAQWWNSVVKTVVLVRDLNTVGHPYIHVEVAYFDPIDPAERYNPKNPLEDLLDGIFPPDLGWLGGSPTDQPPSDDPNTPDIGDLFSAAINWGKNLAENFGNTLAGAYLTEVGEAISSVPEFVSNVLSGIQAGQEGVNNHIAHNRTAPDSNGSFDAVPGENANNPKDLLLNDRLQQGYAVNFGSAVLIFGNNATGNSVADSANLHNALISNLNLASANLGISNNGKGTIPFYIHGRTIYNVGNGGTAPNPTIDSNGNLRIYDTYEFQDSNFNVIGNWVSNNINPELGQQLNAFFDTSPGFHTVPSLNSAGAARVINSGGTPSSSPIGNLPSLQNTYTAVVITPSNLKAGNPEAYQNLRDAGYFDHVDPSKLP